MREDAHTDRPGFFRLWNNIRKDFLSVIVILVLLLCLLIMTGYAQDGVNECDERYEEVLQEYLVCEGLAIDPDNNIVWEFNYSDLSEAIQ